MSILLFSHSRVLYEKSDNEQIVGIYIPLLSRTKVYADITNPTTATVKDRYADQDDTTPLWRQNGPYVSAYGILQADIEQRRQAISIFLPQDFVKADTDAFYFIFDQKWVVNGVKKYDENDRALWGISLIEEEDSKVIDLIVGSVSEHLVEGNVTNVLVAVSEDTSLQEDLAKSLKAFEIVPVNFTELSPDPEKLPLYSHRDYSLLMIAFALCAFLVLSASIGYWVTNHFELENERGEIARVKNEIRLMQDKKKLGHVTNPDTVLSTISGGIPHMPSALVSSAAEVSRRFGPINEIKLGDGSVQRRKRSGGYSNSRNNIFNINVRVEMTKNALLLDQERMSLSILQRSPWIDYIKRSAISSDSLDIGVRIK